MKKYNRERRATYNAHVRKINTHDTCDGHDTHDTYKQVHVHMRYDGQKRTVYTPTLFKRTSTARIQKRKHVDIPNAINDIFPDINAPDNAHIYTGTAPYKQFIPQETHYTRPIDADEEHIHTSTKRAKCVIYNRKDEIIYCGIFNRTRTIDYATHEAHTTLHRADRSIEVYPYIPTTDTIYGMDIKEVYKYDVEFYHI